MLIENFQIRKSRGSLLTCHTGKGGGGLELAIHSFLTSVLDGGERTVQGLGLLIP